MWVGDATCARALAVLEALFVIPAMEKVGKMASDTMPNQRDGVDAGWRLLFAFGSQWPGATHRER